MEIKEIDCTGIACPMPVIMAKKALEAAEAITLKVTVDNKEAVENVSRLANSMNLELKQEKVSENKYNLTIIKTGNEAMESCSVFTKTEENMTLLIKSNHFGITDKDHLENGVDVLGDKLMKTFIFSLTESKPYPKKIMFVNSGVFLTTVDKETVKNLKILEENGVEILSCGICLDYYKLKDRLAAGKVGNMYDIVNSLNQSKNKLVI